MDQRYMPKTPAERLAHLTEECGQVLTIIGKAGRFGMDSHHPADMRNHPARNGDMLLYELNDLMHAIMIVKVDLANAGYKAKPRHDWDA